MQAMCRASSPSYWLPEADLRHDSRWLSCQLSFRNVFRTSNSLRKPEFPICWLESPIWFRYLDELAMGRPHAVFFPQVECSRFGPCRALGSSINWRLDDASS